MIKSSAFLAGLFYFSTHLNSAQTMKNQNISFSLITFLFFAWGFMTCLNDLLIPHFKAVFELNYFQAMLVQSAFFSAYFFISLLYFLSAQNNYDLIEKFGYKNTLVIGLLICSVGCLTFMLAAKMSVFSIFLIALFILASGITLIQIAANPYVSILGDQKSASARLNFSQGLNSLGYTIAPVLGGMILFQVSHQSTQNLIKPYLYLTVLFAFTALIFKLLKLPEPNYEKSPTNLNAKDVLAHHQFKHSMLAIFCYVGAEVAVGSILINFLGLENVFGFAPEKADKFLAFYWGGLMIGRFNGAVWLSELRQQKKLLSSILLTLLSTLVIYTMAMKGWDGHVSLNQTLVYLGFVAVNFLFFIVGGKSSAVLLKLFALVVSALLLGAILIQGQLAGWMLIGIGLFNSIMWSNIFTLSLKGMDRASSIASSLLVMMIVGGALIPPMQGYLTDVLVRFQCSEAFALRCSLILPLICYLYLFYYAKLKSFSDTAS